MAMENGANSLIDVQFNSNGRMPEAAWTSDVSQSTITAQDVWQLKNACNCIDD